ncbi:hypothetical protein N7520_004710 [Penicillium odoratum]|uniref:uncharacterized protein n=1 Tax=Penicillium odoratum TaxID=1167516 RepID=UPI002546630E|nr:uncharacterized protein N7520_004710 [Penicillium odoratum]KAJ5765151.1 hypothetical protein N7520_004710 [Penicillium odoratum]
MVYKYRRTDNHGRLMVFVCVQQLWPSSAPAPLPCLLRPIPRRCARAAGSTEARKDAVAMQNKD